MAVISDKLIKKLLAFCFFAFLVTDSFAQVNEVSIIRKGEKAIGASFHGHHNDEGQWKVTLKGKDSSILGKFASSTDSLVFQPIVPFTYGLTYQLKLKGEVIDEFTIPFPQNTGPAEVLNIYPSSSIIPANLLKIHIEFSRAMQEGNSKEFVKVLNKNDEMVEGVFLDLQPELWNDDRTRLTLWLDPGRIKRDLQPNLQKGPPLVVGDNIHIVISKSWKDIHGIGLICDFEKTYQVTRDDREKPQVDQWHLKCPKANSLNSLIVEFNNTIDFELANSALHIMKDDQIIAGEISLANNETSWIFSPVHPWSAGNYVLIAEYRLEDLAGNNLNRLFDRDLRSVDDEQIENEHYQIQFVISELSMQ
jgi:hypothetical protein